MEETEAGLLPSLASWAGSVDEMPLQSGPKADGILRPARSSLGSRRENQGSGCLGLEER